MTADSNLTPVTTLQRLSAEVEPVPLVLRSDTVIYDAATQRPVDELLVTFHLAYHHISVCQSLLDAASGYLVHLRSPRPCMLVPCKHIQFVSGDNGRPSVWGRQLDDKSVV